MFDAFLNVIFGPLLGLGPFWCLFFLSLIVSVITILFTKIFTNQVEMKVLKDELKKYQKQMKELKKDPNKLMEVQKKAMRVNMR